MIRAFRTIHIAIVFFLLFLCSVKVIAQPVVCPLTNADMTPTCIEACIICDIDGYTGTHESNVNGVLPNTFCTFFVHNAQWIGFQAASTDLTIQLTVSNCDQGVGLEMAIYESFDCVNFKMVSNCLGGMGGIVGEGESGVFRNTVPLVIGQYYYLAMDGGMGDNCDWTLNVLEGSTELAPLASAGEVIGDKSLCIHSQETYSVNPTVGVTTYKWYVNSVLIDSMANTSIDYNFVESGEYEICVVASNVCSTSPPSCTKIMVGEGTTTEIKDTICQGQVYDFGGSQFNLSGIYPAVFTSAKGCDSTVLLNLFIQPILRDTSYYTLCAGDTIVTPMQLISQSGTFIDTLTSMKGCDSMSYYIIVAASPFFETVTIERCEGDTLFTQQHIVTTSGIFLDSLVSINNCGSIVRYEVSFLRRELTTITIINCENDPFELNGIFYEQDTSFNEVLLTISGCDSIVNYKISFTPPTRDTVNIDLCEGEQIMINSLILDAEGEYLDTLVNAQGCDSIVIYDVSMIDVALTSIRISNCTNDPFELNGVFYRQDTIFTIDLVATSGCDSIVNYDISYKEIARDTLSFELCEGAQIVVNSLILDAEGQYFDTLINAQGCDSILTILVVEKSCMINSIFFTDDIDCHGDSTGQVYVQVQTGALPIFCRIESSDGNLARFDSIESYTDTLFFKSLPSGMYNIILKDQNGEQAKTTVTIHGRPKLSISENVSDYNGYSVSCHGYNDAFIYLSIDGGSPPYSINWPSGAVDTILTQLFAGTYEVLIRDSLGCEKYQTFQLTEPTPITIDLQISKASCDQGDNIELVDIDGGVPPYTPVVNGITMTDLVGPPSLKPGQYAFEIFDNNGCSNKDEIDLKEAIQCDIYIPNVLLLNSGGVNDYFGIFLSNKFSGSFQALKIYDRWGNLIFSLNDFIPSQDLWDGTLKGMAVEQGVYPYILEYTVETIGKRVISGDVTVVR